MWLFIWIIVWWGLAIHLKTTTELQEDIIRMQKLQNERLEQIVKRLKKIHASIHNT